MRRSNWQFCSMGLGLIVGLALCVLSPKLVVAQAGVSSASVSAAQAGLGGYSPYGAYQMPSPESFRIEEFVNFHRHQLPLPPAGQRVHFDLQQMHVAKGKTVVQVGITTPRAIDCEKMPPLNVVLVVDRSGSMQGDRIEKVRQSIRSFAEQFRSEDKLAIVGFGNEAKVDLPAADATSFQDVCQAIDGLQADYGGTNLHAGLMLGYQTVMKNYDPKRTNRVIFLTDGNANVGLTESEEIARQSSTCNQMGISLVTIGLGVDFNEGLLRQISDAGLGPMHYVASCDDIQKVFVDEVDSLLRPAAKSVSLEVISPSDATLQFFGYQVQQKKRRYKIQLDDLNHGATQVVLLRLPKESAAGLRFKLSYVDAMEGENVCFEKEMSAVECAESESIRRNYAIALLAKSLRASANLSNKGQNQLAAKRLDKSLSKLDAWATEDQDVQRVAKIVGQYQERLTSK